MKATDARQEELTKSILTAVKQIEAHHTRLARDGRQMLVDADAVLWELADALESDQRP